MACMRDGVRKFVPHPLDPRRVPGAAPAAGGSGLDAAFAAIPEAEDKEDRPRKRDKAPEGVKRPPKRSVSQVLQEKARMAGEEDELERQRKRRKRKARSSGGVKRSKDKKEKDDEIFSSESSMEESESSGGSVFQRPPTRGGERPVETGSEKPGKTPSQWDGGDVSVPGRSGRGQSKRSELGPEKGHGLREPDHAGEPSEWRSCSSQSKGGSNPGVGHRPSPGGVPGGSRGPPNATSEGVGDGHAGSKLAGGETPGAHQPSGSIPYEHRREGDGQQDRTEDDQAEERHNEGQSFKVGRRRRRRHKKGSLRDASWEKSQQEPDEGRPGAVQGRDEIHPSTARRSERERSRSSPRRKAGREERRSRSLPISRRGPGQKEKEKEEVSPVLEKEEEVRGRKQERHDQNISSFREESNPPSISEEGSATEVEEANMDEVLLEFRKWLQSNDVGGLTVAQMGAYMVIQLKKSSTGLSKFLLRMITEPPGNEGEERQRSILPLPLKPDSITEIKKIWEGEEYRRLMGSWSEKKKMSANQVQRGMRRTGLLVWHGLLVAGVNYLWSGCRWRSKPCYRKPTKAQQACLDRFWKATCLFVDDVSEIKDKLVKSPGSEEWKERIEGMRIPKTKEK